MRIAVEINGERYEREVEPRTLLSDFIRHDCGLTGTHVGCEHGVCGACTIQLDGVSGALVPAARRAGGRPQHPDRRGPRVRRPLQEAFTSHHALQCGFCTPGILMTIEPLLGRRLDEAQIRDALSGNLCRCTGYVQIVEAIEEATHA